MITLRLADAHKLACNLMSILRVSDAYMQLDYFTDDHTMENWRTYEN